MGSAGHPWSSGLAWLPWPGGWLAGYLAGWMAGWCPGEIARRTGRRWRHHGAAPVFAGCLAGWLASWGSVEAHESSPPPHVVLASMRFPHLPSLLSGRRSMSRAGRLWGRVLRVAGLALLLLSMAWRRWRGHSTLGAWAGSPSHVSYPGDDVGFARRSVAKAGRTPVDVREGRGSRRRGAAR